MQRLEFKRLSVPDLAVPQFGIDLSVDQKTEQARELWKTQLASYFAQFGYLFSDFTFHFPPQPHTGSRFTYTIDGDRVDNGDTAVHVANAKPGDVSSWHFHEQGEEYYFLQQGEARLNGIVLPLQKVVKVPTWVIHNVVAYKPSLLLLRTTGIRGVPRERIHTTLDPVRAREMGLQGKNAQELLRQGAVLPLLQAT